MSILLQIIVSNIAISAISLVGVFSLFHSKVLTPRTVPYYVSFAAGVMLVTGFLGILPEAFEHLDPETSLLYVLAGIVGSFFLERFVLWYHHHHDDTHNLKPAAWLVIAGDAIHNVVDGLAIAATFLVNPGVGILTTIAVAAHEIPQEFADFTILIHSGFTKKKALFFNFLSALTAIGGGILGYFFFSQSEASMPYILSIAGGMFIYIACADLIPELHHDGHKKGVVLQSLLFVLGIIFMICMMNLLPHGH